MGTVVHNSWKDPVYVQRMLFILVITVIGTFLYAVGINLFFVPHHFLAGGLTGIAMIIYYLSGISIGILNFVLSIPILLLSLRFMGTFYTIITILGTICLSVFIDATAFMAEWEIVKEPMVAAISGGVVTGIALGILYRYNSNGGGLDVIGAIIKKFYNLEIGNVVFALNFLVIVFSMWIFTVEPAICTLIAMYIGATVSNRIVIGFAQQKVAFITSDRPLHVIDTVIRNVHHGATVFYGQGGFSGEDKKIVFTIVDLTQVTKLRHFIEDVDPRAFIFIMNTTDVIGNGFSIPSELKIPEAARYTRDAGGNMVPTPSWKRALEQEDGK